VVPEVMLGPLKESFRKTLCERLQYIGIYPAPISRGTRELGEGHERRL
jgi:hypothetical protein